MDRVSTRELTAGRRRLLAVLLSVGVVLVLARGAGAAFNEIVLTGSPGNDVFVVSVFAGDPSQLELCAATCFTRSTSEVDALVVNAFDGDDLFIVDHSNGFVSNAFGQLPITFAGGTGDDWLAVCGAYAVADCTVPVDTTVESTPEVDERRIVQVHDAAGLPATTTITTRGVTLIRDESPGALTVAGTSGDDLVTRDSVQDVDRDFAPTTLGRLVLGGQAPVWFGGKTSVTVDVAEGADRIGLVSRAGLANVTVPCAAPTAVTCIVGDGGVDDRVDLTGTVGGAPEDVVLAARPGGALLTGVRNAGVMDLAGIDVVDLTLQASEGDALALPLGASDDLVELTPDGGTGALTLRGSLDVTGTPAPLPTVVLPADGTSAHRLSVDGAAGHDQVLQRGTPRSDVVALRAQGPGCSVTSVCLELDVDGVSRHRTLLAGFEHHGLEGDAGDDLAVVDTFLAATTDWTAGEGHDGVSARGAGERVTIDLPASTVTHAGHGPLALSGVEDVSADVATAGLTVVAGGDDDVLHVHPVDERSVRLTRDGDGRVIHGSRIDSTLVVDTSAGVDHVVVSATDAADTVGLGRGTDLGVDISGVVPMRLAGAEATTIRTLGGDDQVLASGTGGPGSLVVDAGPGRDVIDHTDPASTASVDIRSATEGRITAQGPPLDVLAFEEVVVEGDGADASRLAVTGSDAGTTVTQAANTVTVGHATAVRHTGFRSLLLEGGPATDTFRVDPASTSGLTGLTVAGGVGAGDSLTVLGTTLGEAITFTPTGDTSGSVAVAGAPLVSLGDIEDLRLDGRTTAPSADTLRIATPTRVATVSVMPGSSADAGAVAVEQVDGPGALAPPVTFAQLGAGMVVLPGAPEDHLVVVGQSDADTFDVTTRAAATEAVVSVDNRVPVVAPGARDVVLDGLAGADTFRVPASHPLPGTDGVGISVVGGDAAAEDALTIIGGGRDVVSQLPSSVVREAAGSAGIHHDGIQRLVLDLAGRHLTVAGGNAPDSLTWEPTGAAAGVLTGAGVVPHHLTGTAGLLVDAGGGADRTTVLGGSGPDLVDLSRATTSRVEVQGRLPIDLAPSVESLGIDTRTDADTITVAGSGGPAALAVEGGVPAGTGDRVRIVARDVTVAYGATSADGRLDTPGGAVSFSGIEHVDAVGDGPGTLVVRGSEAADTISTGTSTPARVLVNGAAEVTHVRFDTAVIEGRAGADRITVGYTALADASRVEVRGGDDGDHLDVVDTAGTTRTFEARPVGAGEVEVRLSGAPTVVVATATEALRLDGRGSNDQVDVVSPAGTDDVVVTPALADGGTVAVGAHVPVAFAQLGSGGAVQLQDTAGVRSDRVTLEGSAGADVVQVDGRDSTVRRPDHVPLLLPHTADLTLRGHDGDDAFTVFGALPYGTTTIDGGGPDLGDRVHVQNPIEDVAVDLAAATVTGYGGTISIPQVVDLTTDVGGRQLLQHGTPRDDALCFDPQSPRDGRLYVVGGPGGGAASSICVPDQRGVNVLHTFLDVARLVADPGPGVDEVIVNGTAGRDLMTVVAESPHTVVTLHPEPESGSTFRLPLEVVVASTESVVVATDNGNDSIDVTAKDSVAPRIVVDGEGPDTMHAGDDMLVRDGSGRGHMRDLNSQVVGSGTVTVTYRSGNEIRIDYRNLEQVAFFRDSKVDGGGGNGGGNGGGGGKP